VFGFGRGYVFVYGREFCCFSWVVGGDGVVGCYRVVDEENGVRGGVRGGGGGEVGCWRW